MRQVARSVHRGAVQRLGDERAARWFVEDASGGAWPAVLDEPVPVRAGNFFLSMVERREAGEPVQYVLGHWAFRHLDLMVDRRVLIPRPETEVVVEVALPELARLGGASVVVDLGPVRAPSRSPIASERNRRPWPGPPTSPRTPWRWRPPTWPGLGAPDASAECSSCRAAGGTHCPTVSRLGDLAVANPPYVAAASWPILPAEVSAMGAPPGPGGRPARLGGARGGGRRGPGWLAPRSALVAEIAPHQAGDAVALARRAGFGEVAGPSRPDRAAPRVLVGPTRLDRPG